MIAFGSLERTCWRQFMAQWGDCKKILNCPFDCDYYYYYYYHDDDDDEGMKWKSLEITPNGQFQEMPHTPAEKFNPRLSLQQVLQSWWLPYCWKSKKMQTPKTLVRCDILCIENLHWNQSNILLKTSTHSNTCTGSLWCCYHSNNSCLSSSNIASSRSGSSRSCRSSWNSINIIVIIIIVCREVIKNFIKRFLLFMHSPFCWLTESTCFTWPLSGRRNDHTILKSV